MKDLKKIILGVILLAVLVVVAYLGWLYWPVGAGSSTVGELTAQDRSSWEKPSDEDIKASLSAIQYKVTQQDGTEPPFANKYRDNTEEGIYVDIVSGEPLFSSVDKYKSGTGWPSFTRPISSDAVVELPDNSLGLQRTEIRSVYGDNHIGHVFDDGPVEEGGLRYCMNSAAMEFIPKEELEERGYGEYLSLFE